MKLAKIHANFLNILTFSLLVFANASCTDGSFEDSEGLVGVEGEGDDGEKTASSAATLGGDALVFNPATHEFGPSSSAAKPVNKTIALTNVSSGPVFISEVSGNENANFEILGHKCPISPEPLNGEQSCEVQVSFHPKAAGDLSYEVFANFGVSPDLFQFQSVASFTGKGVVPLDFEGLKEINLAKVTTTKVLLEWNALSGAKSYEVYNVDESTEVPVGVAEVGSRSFLITQLVPNETYRFQVFAINELGIRDGNEVVREVTMDDVPVFNTVPTFSVNEGASGASDDIGLYCTDDEGNKPTNLIIESQTASDGNCAIATSPFAIECAPGYRPAHSTWSTDVTVKCFINDYPTGLNQTVTVTINDTNRAPAIVAVGNKTGLAGVAISTIDINGGADTDVDGDPLTYSCKYDIIPDGSVSPAASDCTSILNLGGGSNLLLNTGLGRIDWTPQMSDATKTYEFRITANDGLGLLANEIFTLSVGNPPPSPSNSLLTVSSGTIASGNTATVTFDARDASNNNIVLGGAAVSFSYAGGTSSVAFAPTVDQGNGTYTSIMTGYTVGTATTIQADINGTTFTGTKPTVQVTPGPISEQGSVVSISGTTIASGSTLNVTLRGKDAAGNNVTVGGATVTFSRTGGTSTGSFSATTDNGDGTYTAIFTGLISGTPTSITATVAGNAVTTPVPAVTVTPGPESVSTSTVQIIGSPATVAADATVSLKLTARDAAGNLITSGGKTVTFVTSGGTSTGTFSSSTDNGDGTYTATFTGVTSGTVTQIVGRINGTNLTTIAPSIAVVPGAISTANSLVAVSSPTVVSGAAVNVTLTTRDSQNNIVSAGGVTVAFSNMNGTSTGSFGTITNNGDGTYTTVFTGVLAGTATDISASIDSIGVSTTLPQVTVSPGTNSLVKSEVTVSGTSVQSTGTIVATLTLKDAAGNLTGGTGQTVVFSASGGTSTGSFSGTTDNANGTYTAVFTGVTSGTPTTIGATLNGSPITSPLPTVAVNPGPASTANSTITVSSGTVASGNLVTITVQTRDANNNLIANGGETVVISNTGGTSTGTIPNSGAATDNSNGTYTTTFSGLVAGTPTTVQATIGGALISSGNPSIAVVPGPISPAQSAVIVSSPTVAAGSSITVTLRSKDAGGNNLTTGGKTIVFAHAGGSSTGTFSSVTDNADGTYRATFTGNISGVGTVITATIDGTPVTSSLPTVTVTPGPISTVNSLVTVSAATVASGGSVNVTLTSYDGQGNLITSGGRTVAFSTAGGSSTGTFGAVNDNGNGSYTATFTGVVSGSATTINATINAVAVTSTMPTIGVVPGPVSLAQSSVVASSPTVVSANTITLTVTTRDANNNLISSGGNTVVISNSGGTSTGTISPVTDNGNGTYQATFVGLSSGTPTTITATINAATVTSTLPTVTVQTGPIDVTQSQVLVSASTVASGSSVNVTVIGKDINGNTLSIGGDTIVFNRSGGSSTGSFSAVTDNADGTYSAAFNGLTAGTATTIGATINGVPVSSTLPTVQVAPGNSSLAQSVVSVSAPAVSSGSTITVTLVTKDGNGNNLTAGGLAVAFTQTGGTSTGTFGNFTDHGNGRYSATYEGVTSGTPTTIGATISAAAVTSTLPTVTVNPGPLSLADTTVTVGSGTINSGASTTITLTAYDAAGNRVTASGDTVVFTYSGGNSTGNLTPTADNGNGTYTSVFTGQASGTATTIAATVNTLAVTSVMPTIIVNVGTISLSQSTVTVSSNTVASASSISLTAILRDAYGNQFTTGGQTVVFNRSGGTSTGVISATTDNGDGSYVATFTANVAGTATNISATVGGSPLSSAPQPVTVNAGAVSVSQSLVTVSAAAIISGNSATVTLQTKDSNGNNLPTGGETVAFTYSGGSSTGTFTGLSDLGNGRYTAVFNGLTAGTATTINATINGVPVSSTLPTIGVSPGPFTLAQSSLTVSATSLSSGSSINVTLQTKDSNNNNLTTGGETVVFTYSGGTSTGTFSPVTDNGNGSYTATFTGLVSGTPTTFAASLNTNPITSTLPNVTVNPGAFSLANSTVVVSSPTVNSAESITVTLTAKDANNNQHVSGGLTIGLSNSGGTSTGTFSSVTDNGNGTYSATFTGLAVGTATTVNATINGSPVTSSLPTVTVNPGAFSLSNSYVTVSSGTVSSGSSINLTLFVKDANNNNLSAGGETVVFGRTGGTSTGNFGSTTDVGNGTYTATFTGVTAGSATTITTTINGASITSVLPTTTVIPGPVSLTNSIITLSAANVQSGTAATMTLTLRDGNNNQLTAGGKTVVFTNSGGSSTGTISATTDNADGTYTATFSGIVSGSATTINATVDTDPIASTLPTLTVLPGPASLANSTIVVTGSPATVQAGSNVNVIATLKDANNNQLTLGGATLVFNLTGGTSTASFSAVTDNNDGTYETTLTGLLIGTAVNIGANVNGSPITSTLPSISVVPGPISAVQSVITVSAATTQSGATVNVTLTAKDGGGNPISSGGETVVFSRSGGTSTGSFSAVTDNTNGTYSATFTGISAGTATTVGGTINGTPVSSTLPTIIVTPGAQSAANSVVTLSSATVPSGSTITVTLRARDINNNNLTTGGGVVTIGYAGGTSSGTVGTVNDNGDGTYTATFAGLNKGTPTTVTATYDGSSITTTMPTITVLEGLIDKTQSTIAVSSTTVASGSNVTITLQGKDANGNNKTTGGAAVSFAHTGGSSTGSIGSVTDNGDGTYTAVFTGLVSGTATSITAEINGNAVTTASPTILVNPGAISLSNTIITTSSPTVISGNTITLTLQAKDSNNNSLTAGGKTVVFNRSGGASTGTIGATTDLGNGTYRATFIGLVAGSATTIGATVDGSPVISSLPTVGVLVGPINEGTSVVTVSNSAVASGSNVTLTLSAKDINGNALVTGGATIVFNASGGTSTGTIGATSDNANGTYTAVFSGVTSGTPTNIGATINGSSVTTAKPTVTVTPGNSSAAQSIITLSSASVGSGSSINVTMQAKDAVGNNHTVGGLTVVFNHSGGASTGTFSAVTDLGDGTYTSTFTGVVSGAATTVGATINGTAVTSSLPTVQVNPGPYSVTTSTVSVSAASVVSGNAITATLQAKDSAGNNLILGGQTVAFSRTGGGSNGTFAIVNDVGDGTYTSVFTGTTSGTPTTVNATINAVTVTTSMPTVTVTPGAISTTTSLITLSSSTVASGSNVTLTLQAKDASGNTITTGGATVAFTRTGGTSTGTIGSTTDNSDGTYTALFTGQVAGTATSIGATITGAPVSTALPTLTVTVGPVAVSMSTVTLSAASVASGSNVTATLTARDQAGNALTAGGATVTFNYSGGVSTVTFAGTNDNSDGTYTAVVTGVLAGAATDIGAFIGGVPLSTAKPSLTVTPGPFSLTTSVVTLSSSSVISGSSIDVTLRAKDAAGNSIVSGGQTVAFSHSGGLSTGTFGAVTDNGNGTYNSSFTGSVAGTPTTVGATINAANVVSTMPTIQVNPAGISAANSTVTLSAATVSSGASVTATLTAKDLNNNLLGAGGATILFGYSGGTSTGSFATVTDVGDGTYTAVFTGNLSGTLTTLTATINGSTVTTAMPTLTVTPGALNLAQSVVTVSSATVVSGTNITLTMRARDAAGNNITGGGETVVFSASGGTSTGTIGATTDNANGTYIAVFTGVASGTATSIGAAVGGSNLTSAKPTVTVSTAGYSLAKSVVSVSSPTVISGNVVTLTVDLKDLNNNNITGGGQTVAFTHLGGTSAGSISATTDNNDGTYTATFTATTAGSPTTINATVGGSNITNTLPTVTVSPGAYTLSSSNVTISGSPANLLSGSGVNVTLTARDIAGNKVSAGGETIAFTFSGGSSTVSFTSLTDQGDGTYTATMTGVLSGTAINIGANINGAAITSVKPSITILPGTISTTTSLVTVSSSTVNSGNTVNVTLYAKDAAGNNLTAGGSTVVFNHTNGTSSGTFAATADGGNGTYTSVFTAVNSGTPTDIGATIGGSAVTSTPPTVTVNPGAASVAQSIISVSAASVSSGNSITLTLRARDAAGNNLTSGGLAVVFNNAGGASTGTISATTDNTNGTYIATFQGLVSGAATSINATINAVSVTSPSPTVTVIPGAISTAKSTITASSPTVASNSLVTLTLTARDANNNLIGSGGQAVTFNYSGGASTGSINTTSDQTDGTYTATFTGTVAGTATTITALINGSAVTTPGAATVQVIPGPISLVKTTVAVTAATIASGVSTAVTLQARDSNNNNLTTGGETVVFNYSGGTSTGSFSSISDNGNGTYSASFTGILKGTPTTITSTVGGSNVTSPAPTVTVTEGVISTTTSLVSVSSPTVSSGNTITLTMTAKDAAGNLITSGGETISFTRTGGTSTGNISATTDNTDGTYSASFVAVLAGSATNIQGKISGVNVSTALPTVTVSSGSSSTAQSTITLSGSSVASGSAITATLQVKDAAGNNVITGGQTIIFNCTSGSSTCSVGTTTDVGNGSYTAEITGVLAGTATTVGATLDGSAVSSTLPTLTVGAGPISLAQSLVTVSSGSVASGLAITATLQAKDAAGNNLTSGGGTVVFTQGGGTSAGTFAATTDNTNGTYIATFTGTASGTATNIGATYNAGPITSLKPSVTVNPGAISVTTSTITLSSASVLSGNAINVTLQAKDAHGNNLTASGSTVTFSRSGGTSSGTFSVVSDNLDGTYTASFTGTTSGTATNITAQISGSNVTSGNPTVTVSPGAASASHSTVTVSSGTVFAGSNVTVTLTARDASNNALTAGGLTVTFGHAGGSSAGVFAATTNVGNGTYTAIFTGQSAGTATTVTATIGGSNVTTSMPTITVNAGGISAANSLVTVSSGNLSSGNAITVTLEARDTYNNVITSGGETVAFNHTGGVSSGSFGVVSDTGTGIYKSVFTGQTAGSPTTITATINGSNVTTTMPTVTVNPGAYSLVTSVVTVSAGTITSGNAVTVTMTLKDAAGNSLGATYGTGQTVSFAYSGGVSTGSFGATADVGNGTYTATFTGLVAGSATSIVGSIGASNVTSAAPTVTVTPGAVSILKSVVSVSSASVVSGSSVVLSLQPKDVNNNNIDNNALSVVFSSSGGTSTGNVGAAAYNVGGVYTATFTGVLAGTATTIGASIGGSNVTFTPLPTVTVGVGAISLAQSVISVSSATVVSGTNITLTLDAKDANGNNITTGGETVAFSHAGGSSTGNIGTTSDPGTGIYTAVLTGITSGTATTVNATINTVASTYSPKPTVTVSVGPYSLSGSTISVSATTVTSGNTITITMQARDVNSNAITSSIGVPVAFSNSGGVSTLQISAPTDNADGTYTATAIGKIAGSATTLSTTINAAPVSSPMPSITVNVGSMSPANSITTVSAGTVASGSSVNLTMTARDVNNNNITSSVGTVTFAPEADGTSTGSISTITDNGNGTYVATFTGSTSGTPISITTTAAGQTLATTKPVIQVNPGPFALATSPVTASATTVASGSSITLTLFARDAAGNQITSGGLSLLTFVNTTSGTSTGTIGGVADQSNGTYTAVFTAITAGTATQIKATQGGSDVTGTRPNITVIPGPYDVATSTITSSAATIAAGSTTTVTLTLKDANSNQISAGGQTVLFGISGGTSDGSFSGQTDLANGRHRIVFTGEDAGTASTFTATVDSTPVTGSAASVTVNPGTYTVANSVVSVSNNTVPSATSITLSLQLRDAYNNTVTSGTETVAFSYTGGSSTGSISATSHIMNGRYEATFSGLLAGTATSITSAINAVAVTSPLPQVTVTPGPYTLANSFVTLSASSVVAGSQVTATLRLRDSNNNFLTTDGGITAVVFTRSGGTSNGSFDTVSNVGDGTFTAAFTGSTAGTAMAIGATLDSAPLTSAKPNLTVTTNSPQPSGLTMVTPPSSRGNISTPTIRVSGVANGFTVNVYSDTCTTEVTDGPATGATLDFVMPAQGLGTTTYYANTEDAYGNKSTCSATGVTYEYDNAPPPNPATVIVGSYTQTIDTSPLASWTSVAAADFDHYEVTLERQSDGVDLITNLNVGTNLNHTFTGLTMTECVPYQVIVKSVDNVTNRSSGTTSSTTFLYDNTAPTGTTVSSIGTDGNVTKAPTVSWSGTTDNCGPSQLSYYEYAIGTTPGATDILGWTNIGSVTSYQAQGLSMIKDTDYFSTIRVTDKAGKTSTPVNSSAWQVSGTGRGVWTSTVTTSGANLNQTEAGFKWDAGSYDAGVYSHSTVTNAQNIKVNTSGDYLLSFTAPLYRSDTNDSRNAVHGQVKVGTTSIPFGRMMSSYTRGLQGSYQQTNSSIHLTVLLEDVAVDDNISITIKGDGNTDFFGTSGATLYLEFMGNNKNLFMATSTQSTNGTNLNQATPYPLEWTSTRADTSFDHTGSPENIEILDDGLYLVHVNIPFYSTIERASVLSNVKLDGVDVVGGKSAQGYIRSQQNHYYSSTHWSGLVQVTGGVGQTLTVTVQRDSETGTVTVGNTFDGYKASITIEKLDETAEPVFHATMNQLETGTNWATATANPLQWNTPAVNDPVYFTHNASTTNPEQITIMQPGSYLFVYNDMLQSNSQRVNPKIALYKNDSIENGAECRSHYIRGPVTPGNHLRASCVIVYYFDSLITGDIISVKTIKGDETGTHTTYETPTLTIVKKANSLWDPTKVDNLDLWVDASDPTTLFQSNACTTPATVASDPVGCWMDKSVNGYHLTQATDKPVIGTTGISFDGVNDILTNGTLSITATSNKTVFVVAETDTQNNSGTECCRPIVSWMTNSSGLYPWIALTKGNYGPNNALMLGFNSTPIGPILTAPGDVYVASATHDRSVKLWNGWANGTQKATNETIPNNYSATTFNVGGDSSVASRKFKGQVYEVVVYNSVLGTLEREQIEGYLACKWDVRSRLDPAHPFYDASDTSKIGCP